MSAASAPGDAAARPSAADGPVHDRAGRRLLFITHPEVLIDPAVPVPDWGLAPKGLQRLQAALGQPWLDGITSLHASTERKAVETAEVLARHLSLPVRTWAALGENDRSSTGFLPGASFEVMADAFFASPEASVRGWERAIDAQRRIVEAVHAVAAADRTDGMIAICSHGAVGTLLHCWLTGRAISRRWDQPRPGGGHRFGFTLQPPAVDGPWRPIDPD